MTYESEIANEELNINSLREQAKKLTVPRRSINYQFQNLRYGNRNQTQKVFLNRQEKRKVNKQIASSQSKIVSLREAMSLERKE